jgi:hypothetical protein
MAITHKACPACGELKTVDEFNANADRPDGFGFYCRVCYQAKAKEYYRRKRESKGFRVRPRVAPPAGRKWCPDCQEYLLIESFPRNASAKDGLNSYCKQHHIERGKRTYFERRYGIQREQVERMLDEQGGLCLICQRDLAGKGHVDHDHETGEVRGILCFPCNGGLGQFREDTAILLRAVQYLDGTLAS